MRSLEIEDASATTTALMTLQRWMERIAEKEVERITVKCRRYLEQGKPVPGWVRAGMDERFGRVEQIEQRIQMLLGIFFSHGALPLELKPAYSVGDLLLQHLDAFGTGSGGEGRRVTGLGGSLRQDLQGQHDIGCLRSRCRHRQTDHVA